VLFAGCLVFNYSVISSFSIQQILSSSGYAGGMVTQRYTGHTQKETAVIDFKTSTLFPYSPGETE
jgi:hypothetical protein